MGEVWLAEQREPIRRKVAFKIIKVGMDTASVVARFEAERQALALMDHPNIAKVFEAGSTPQGRPYFVMEYVQGVSITEYCDLHRLRTPQRLELFIRVCDGVQHAHHKAVIHRDLKPSNILVTEVDGQPVPKIIDFGVAKATGQRLTDQTMVTEFGQVIGTPAYMSPEQARLTGEDVDTRTDVYSLGIVLYELLVGALPFDPRELQAGSFEALRRVILETDPPRPSSKITTLGDQATPLAANRQSEPRKLAAQLKGDLDWIVLKTLEKERSRRYETVHDLRADILRHLHDEPVLASPPSTSYRLHKLVRRHKAAVTGAAAVLLVLVLGIAASTWGLLRARQAEKQSAREAAIAAAVNGFLNDDLLAAVAPSARKGRGRDVLMREVLDAAAARIDEAAKPGARFANEPLVEGAIRKTLWETYVALGENAAAEPHLRRVVELRERAPESPELAVSLCDLSSLSVRAGRYSEAESLLVRAVDVMKRVASEDSLVLLNPSFSLATLYLRQGRFAEAEPMFVQMLGSYRRVAGPEHARTLAAMQNLGNLYQEAGRFAEAESLQSKLLEIRLRTEGEEEPNTLSMMNNLANTLSSQGQLTRANDLLVRALELKRRVLGPEHPSTLNTESGLASLYYTLGDYAQAERLTRETLAVRDRVLGPDHPITQTSRNDLAFSVSKQGRFGEAKAVATKTLATCQATLGDSHSTTITALFMVALCEEGQGRLTDAESSLRRVLGQIEAADATDPLLTGLVEAHLGLVLGKLGQRDEARSILEKSLPELPLWDAETRSIIRAAIPMYEAWHKVDPAGQFDKQAADLRARLAAENVVGSTNAVARVVARS
jgi:non-specific serine/threonine protein kinase/serine/threonine-protein kinase